jgi:hypothetical protein
MNSINKFISQYGNNIDVCSFINNKNIASINKFIKFDKFYSKSFGEEIESLYNNKDYVLGIHGSRDSFPKTNEDENEMLNLYFNNGIENISDNRIEYTVKLKTQGLELQDFLSYSYGPSDSPKFIVMIPVNGITPSVNPMPIWNKYNIVYYLLPQYIYGCIENLGSREVSIIKNDNYMKNLNFDNLVYDKSIIDSVKKEK